MVAKNSKSGRQASQAQSADCTDKNCPVHGSVKLRGRSFVGTVASDKMSKTVVVTWTRRFFVKKFERYERRMSRMSAHNPDCISAKKGDIVRITETRPLSKTKQFTVTEVIGRETAREHVKSETIDEEDAKEAISRKKAEASSKSEE